MARIVNGLDVSVAWRIPASWRAAALLQRVADVALRAEGFRRGRLSLAVVGDREMATLHRRHLHIDGPTDVLTFDLGCDAARELVDGEIVVCADVALRHVTVQRATRAPSRPARGVSLAARARQGVIRDARVELALYTVHGVLHLAGYDDRSRRDAQEMHAREDMILTKLGLGAAYSRWRAPG